MYEINRFCTTIHNYSILYQSTTQQLQWKKDITTLLDIDLNQFDWSVLIRESLITTDPHLQVISGGLRQLFAEPWRVVEGAAGTSGSTAISIPERVIREELEVYMHCTSLTEVVIADKVWYEE